MMQLHLSNQNDTEKSQNDRLNNIMLVLTIVTVVMLPYSILSGLFGMNVNLPMQATDDTAPPGQRDFKYYLFKFLPFIGIISSTIVLSLMIGCGIRVWWNK